MVPMDIPKGPWGISAIKFFRWSQYQISALNTCIQVTGSAILSSNFLGFVACPSEGYGLVRLQSILSCPNWTVQYSCMARPPPRPLRPSPLSKTPIKNLHSIILPNQTEVVIMYRIAHARRFSSNPREREPRELWQCRTEIDNWTKLPPPDS